MLVEAVSVGFPAGEPLVVEAFRNGIAIASDGMQLALDAQKPVFQVDGVLAPVLKALDYHKKLGENRLSLNDLDLRQAVLHP